MALQILGEGFNFRPKEEEVVKYLVDKVTGSKTLGCDFWIGTADLYGDEEPCEIFRKHCGGDTEVFLFTKLKKVAAAGRGGQRFSRNVGQGVWCNKGQKDPIFGPKKGQIIGHKRCYRYDRKKKGGGGGGGDGNGKWLLKEYTLPESVRVKEEYRDYALCRLKRKDDDGGGRKNHHGGPDVEIGFEEMLEAVLKRPHQKSPQQPAPQQPAVPSCGGGDEKEEEEEWMQMIDWNVPGDFVCDQGGGNGGDWNVPGSDCGFDQVSGGGELQGNEGGNLSRIPACGVVEGLFGGGGGVDDYYNLNRRLSGGPPVLL